MDYDELIELGFDADQINQIIKLEPYINIKFIEPEDDVSLLRKLNKTIKEDPRNKKVNKLILKAYREGVDAIDDWLAKGICTCNKLNFLYTAYLAGYDCSKIKESYTIDNLKLIMHYKKEGYDIEEYIDNNKTDNEISDIISGLKLGVNVEDLLNAGYTNQQVYRILEAKEKGYDLLSYIDQRYSAKQMDAIIWALDTKEDITDILNPDYLASIMRTIMEAKLSGVDLIPHIKPTNNNVQLQMKVVLLKAKKDPSILDEAFLVGYNYNNITKAILKDIDLNFLKKITDKTKGNKILGFKIAHPHSTYDTIIENEELNGYQFECMKKLISKNIEDTRPFEKYYSQSQMDIIMDCLLKNHKIDNILHPELPAKIMRAIVDCESYGIIIEVPDIGIDLER